MSDTQINAASRVSNFLRSFQRAQGQLPNYSVLQILEHMYGLGDERAASELLSNIWQLPNQVRDQIKLAANLNPEPFLERVSSFEFALSHLALSQHASMFTNQINGLPEYFDLIGATLNSHVPEPTIELSDREKLINDLDELLASLERAKDIDDKFKAYVRQKLEALLYALRNYDLLGSEALVTETQRMLGFLVWEVQDQTTARSETKMGYVNRMFHIANSVLFLCNLLNAPLQLETNIVKVLEANTTQVEAHETPSVNLKENIIIEESRQENDSQTKPAPFQSTGNE